MMIIKCDRCGKTEDGRGFPKGAIQPVTISTTIGGRTPTLDLCEPCLKRLLDFAVELKEGA